MMFVYPSFLWALAAVAIPVIIHLFNFRKYKKVYFTNVRFLRELQEESKSRSRLKELLVLLARCLAIVCLVLAFAQPVYQPEGSIGKAGPRDVSIYIDNSFSMQNVNRQGALLDIARARAKEVIAAFGNSARFQVITNDFEGRHQRFSTWENATELVDEIKVSPVARPLSAVVKRQSEFLRTSAAAARKIYIFSDAQKTTFDIEALRPDTGIGITIVPIASNRVNNVYVDTCWFAEPLQQKGFVQKLHARVRNSSSSPIEAGSAKLFINERQTAIASFSIGAYEAAELVFSFECKTSGLNYGAVKITDYPVTFDDELFFAFNSRINVSVCLVNGGGDQQQNAFASLFSGDSLFRFRSFPERAVDYNHFKSSDVIILNELAELSSGLQSELLKFCRKGGALVIVPPRNPERSSYNAALSSLGLPQLGAEDTMAVRTGEIELGTGFFTGVFEKMSERMNLPLVNRHFRLLKGTRSNFQPLLRLQNGDDFFGSAVFSNATVYLFAGPLQGEAGNFSKHALFVPTFYQLSFRSLQPLPLFYTVSENVVIPLRNTFAPERPPHIRQTSGSVDIIPELRVVNNGLTIRTGDQVNLPGFYNIMNGDTALQPLAFNYPRRESDLAVHAASELEAHIAEKGWKHVSLISNAEGSFSQQVLLGAEGKKLWKIFIILALIFISIELALLRFLK